MQDFLRQLHTATPRTWVTNMIIGLNVAAFGLATLAGVDFMAPTAQSLLEVGGNWLPATREQPWRLLSAMFLHAGLIHIGFNMWALRDMGRIAERFYGNTQFLLIYLLSGLFASLASLFFSAASSVSVGASGAVFGVAGAILAALLTKQNKLPPALVTPLRRSMLIFVAYSLFMGFTVSFIDNSAHIGGLVSGFLLATLLAERFDWDNYRRTAWWRALLAVVLSVLIATITWSLLPPVTR